MSATSSHPRRTDPRRVVRGLSLILVAWALHVPIALLWIRADGQSPALYWSSPLWVLAGPALLLYGMWLVLSTRLGDGAAPMLLLTLSTLGSALATVMAVVVWTAGWLSVLSVPLMLLAVWGLYLAAFWSNAGFAVVTALRLQVLATVAAVFACVGLLDNTAAGGLLAPLIAAFVLAPLQTIASTAFQYVLAGELRSIDGKHTPHPILWMPIVGYFPAVYTFRCAANADIEAGNHDQ